MKIVSNFLLNVKETYIMEAATYKPSSWPHSIHVLGNGPYAKEIVKQRHHSVNTKFHFVSSGDDENIFPAMLMVGIANPTIKKAVIEEFYVELERETFISAISSMVVIAEDTWKTNYSARCVNIGPFTSIGHDTEIRDFVSICASVTIGHDCIIAEYSTICPGAVISGNVHIGKAAFIGAGAVIRDGVNIGAHAIVGCGSIVLEDVPHYNVVAGNPARYLRFREEEELCPT